LDSAASYTRTTCIGREEERELLPAPPRARGGDRLNPQRTHQIPGQRDLLHDDRSLVALFSLITSVARGAGLSEDLVRLLQTLPFRIMEYKARHEATGTRRNRDNDNAENRDGEQNTHEDMHRLIVGRLSMLGTILGDLNQSLSEHPPFNPLRQDDMDTLQDLVPRLDSLLQGRIRVVAQCIGYEGDDELNDVGHPGRQPAHQPTLEVPTLRLPALWGGSVPEQREQIELARELTQKLVPVSGGSCLNSDPYNLRWLLGTGATANRPDVSPLSHILDRAADPLNAVPGPCQPCECRCGREICGCLVAVFWHWRRLIDDLRLYLSLCAGLIAILEFERLHQRHLVRPMFTDQMDLSPD
jgi:hypothetical protein